MFVREIILQNVIDIQSKMLYYSSVSMKNVRFFKNFASEVTFV